MSDFPAAHSMDTTWFAVDAEGHIGMFNSGEGGAVPKSNSQFMREYWTKRQDNWCLYELHDLFWQWSQQNENRVIDLEIPSHDILNQLRIDLPKSNCSQKTTKKKKSKIPQISRSPSWIDAGVISNPNSYIDWEMLYGCWLLILSGDETQTFDLLKHHCLKSADSRDYILHFSGEPALIFITYCPKTTLQKLFHQGLVQYAHPSSPYCRDLATALGLFSYIHDYSYPFPYECDGQPIHPLKLDNLPEKLQDILTWTWFDDIKFSESREIQPIEQMKCNTWGTSKRWMDTQGNEREGHPHDRS